MELFRVDLMGRPCRVDAAPEVASVGIAGIDVAGREIDGVARTVVQFLFDDDHPDFLPSLLDGPLVAELTDSLGDVLSRELFDHDVFRRRLASERADGESVTTGVLVLTDGELPPPWIRMAFLPVGIERTVATQLSVRTASVAELADAVERTYAVGAINDDERRALLVSIDQHHPPDPA